MAKWEGDTSKPKDIALNCELVGLKNLKVTHNWRIELDTFEMDQDKVKDLKQEITK